MMQQGRPSLSEPALSFRLRRSPLNSATYRTLVRVLSHCLQPDASGDASHRSPPACPYCGTDGGTGAAGSSRPDGRPGCSRVDRVHRVPRIGSAASVLPCASPNLQEPERTTDSGTARLGLQPDSLDTQRIEECDTLETSPPLSTGSVAPTKQGHDPGDDARMRSGDALVGSSNDTEALDVGKIEDLGDIGTKVSADNLPGDQFFMNLESGSRTKMDELGPLDTQKELRDCIHGYAARDSLPEARPELDAEDGAICWIGDKEARASKNVGECNAELSLDQHETRLIDTIPTQDASLDSIGGSSDRKHCSALTTSCQADHNITVANVSLQCSPQNEQPTHNLIETADKGALTTLLDLQSANLSVSQDDDKTSGSQDDANIIVAEKIENEKHHTGEERTHSSISHNDVAVEQPAVSVSHTEGSCMVDTVVEWKEAIFLPTNGCCNQIPPVDEAGLGVDAAVAEHVDSVIQDNVASECSISTLRKLAEDVNANHSNQVKDELMEEGEMEEGEIQNGEEDVGDLHDTEFEAEMSLSKKSPPKVTVRKETNSISTHKVCAINPMGVLVDYGDLDFLREETDKPVNTLKYKKEFDKTKIKSNSETSSPNNSSLSVEPPKMSVTEKEKGRKLKNGEVRKMTKERKAKKKIAKKRKRAEKNKKLGVKRLKIQPVSMPKKVVDCKYYLIGRCREGETCKFSHDKTPVTKSTPCEHFIHDRCLKGDDCPYDHELSKYPCHNFTTKGSCIRGQKCKFSHEISVVEDGPTRISDSKQGTSKLPGQPSLGIHVTRTCTPNLATNAASPSKLHTSQISMEKQSLGLAQIMGRASQIPPKGIRFLSFEKKPTAGDKKPQKIVKSVGNMDSETQSQPKQVLGLLNSDQRTDEASTPSDSQKRFSSAIYATGYKKPPTPSTLKNSTDSGILKSSSTQSSAVSFSSASTLSAVTEASRLLQEFLFLDGS